MRIYVVKRKERIGLYLPMAGTKDNPNLMFFLPKSDPSQIEDMVRKQLSLQGITKEEDVQKIAEKAEVEYERRIKIKETMDEIKRLMAIKTAGGKLMLVGNKKWKQVFYPK